MTIKLTEMTADQILALDETVKLTEMTADQILALNEHQNRGQYHPFTCANRGDGEHRNFNGDLGALVATKRGWICPWCDYTQDWAHGFMCQEQKNDQDHSG